MRKGLVAPRLHTGFGCMGVAVLHTNLMAVTWGIFMWLRARLAGVNEKRDVDGSFVGFLNTRSFMGPSGNFNTGHNYDTGQEHASMIWHKTDGGTSIKQCFFR